MADTTAKGRRVKVYVLNESGKWDDRGTGHVRCERSPSPSRPLLLKVTAEDTGREALCSTVRTREEAFYQMQSETIISWTEDSFPGAAGAPTEMALSFAEAEGCREVWDKICEADALKPPTLKPTREDRAACTPAVDDAQPLHNSTDAAVTAALPGQPAHAVLMDADAQSPRFLDEQLETPSPWNPDAIDDVIFPDNSNVLFLGNSPALVPGAPANDAAVAAGFVMPDPDRNGIETLSKIMSDQGIIQVPAVRERIIAEVSSGDYVTKLCQVFRHCEEVVDIDGLSMLYHVIRCLFIVGNNSVLEVLVNERHVMDIVGCLEYDPEQLPQMEKNNAKARGQSTSDSAPFGAGLDSNANKPPQKRIADVSPSTPRPDGGNEHSSLPLRTPQGHASSDSKPHSPSRGPKQQQSTDTSPGVKPSQGVPGTEATAEQSTAVENVQVLSSVVSPTIKGEDSQQTLEGQKVPERPIEPISTLASDEGSAAIMAHKNCSEETTSSGNLGGDESDRRFVLRVHRDYLERKVSYKSVVPITDSNVVAKIHQNYRVSYIKDAILSRIFDDGVNNALSSLILFNNVDIIMYFISGSPALRELFDRLKSTVQLRKKHLEAAANTGWRDSSDKHRSVGLVAVQARHGDSDKVRFTDNKGDSEMTDVVKNPRSSVTAAAEQNSSQGNDLNASSGSTKIACHSRTAGESNCSRSAEVLNCKGRSCGEATACGRIANDTATASPRSSEHGEEVQRDLSNMLGFLSELCGVAKNQQQPVRDRFHALLRELGVLEVSVSMLRDSDPALRLLGCDILSAAVIQDQSDVRTHILKDAPRAESTSPKVMLMGKQLLPTSGNESPIEAGITSRLGSVARVGSAMIRSQQVRSLNSAPQSPSAKGPGTRDASNADVQGSGSARTGAPVKVSQREKERSEKARQNLKLDALVETTNNHEKICTAEGNRLSKRPDGNEKRRRVGGEGIRTIESQRNSERAGGGGMATGTGSEAVTVTNVQVAGLGLDQFEETGNVPQNRAQTVLRSSARSQNDTHFPLLSAMIDVICQDGDSGVVLTVLDLMRTLLDPSNMRNSDSDQDSFLDAFYKHFVDRLLEPILKTSKALAKGEGNPAARAWDDSLSHICDLLSYCVSNHKYRSKYFVIGNDVAGKVLALLQHGKAYIRLSALRFFRSCVGRCDDFYDRYLVREGLFHPIMRLYSQNQNRDNLTSSAILELIKFITASAVSGRFFLLEHLIENHSGALEPSIKHCEAFSDAKRVYQSCLANQTSGNAGASTATDNVDVPQTIANEDFAMVQVETTDLSSQLFQNNTPMASKIGGHFRFNAGFFGQEMRIAQEQDNDENFFAGGEQDPAIHDLHSFIDNGPVGLNQGSMASDPRQGLPGGWTENSIRRGGNGDQERKSGSDVASDRPDNLVLPRSLRGSGDHGASIGVGHSTLAGRSGIGGGGLVGGTGLRSCIPASVPSEDTFKTSVGREEQHAFEEAVLGSSWSSKDGEKAPLVPYALDDDSESDDKRPGNIDTKPESDKSSAQNPKKASMHLPMKEKSGRIRLSFSKADGLKGDVIPSEDDGESFCESSDDCLSPRKRERGGGKARAEGGIEICTRSISGADQNASGSFSAEGGDCEMKDSKDGREDGNAMANEVADEGARRITSPSPPKRRRTEGGNGAGGDALAEEQSEVRSGSRSGGVDVTAAAKREASAASWQASSGGGTASGAPVGIRAQVKDRGGS